MIVGKVEVFPSADSVSVEIEGVNEAKGRSLRFILAGPKITAGKSVYLHEGVCKASKEALAELLESELSAVMATDESGRFIIRNDPKAVEKIARLVTETAWSVIKEICEELREKNIILA